MTVATPTCYVPGQLDGFAYLSAALFVEERGSDVTWLSQGYSSLYPHPTHTHTHRQRMKFEDTNRSVDIAYC